MKIILALCSLITFSIFFTLGPIFLPALKDRQVMYVDSHCVTKVHMIMSLIIVLPLAMKIGTIKGLLG